MIGKWRIIALLAAFAGCRAEPAIALVAIPTGAPDGAATDLLTINGTYATPLVSPGTQPFAAPDFTLSLIIPAQILVSAVGPVVSEFTILVSGSYTDDGSTENFTNQLAVLGANSTLPTTPDNFSLFIQGLLAPSDDFSLEFQASSALFSPTIFEAGVPETLSAGTYTVTTGSAGYSTAPDPDFTGTVSLALQASPVPEASSMGLLAAGLAGFGLVRRRRKA